MEPVSRLHSIAASVADIAGHFDAEPPADLEVPSEITEGLAGLVVLEREGRRVLRSMTWGFPRYSREARENGDRPERLGLVADMTNPMWTKTVVDPRYRCLIVLTHFGNPDGVAGEKTRTWFSVKDQPITAWGGFCRNTPEFGPVYAGLTMDANEAIPPTNDRMPVLLDPEDYGRWLRGGIKEAIYFQYRPPFAADRMEILRSEDLWRSGKPPVSKQLALL